MESNKSIIQQLEEKILEGGQITLEEALSLANSEDLESLFATANRDTHSYDDRIETIKNVMAAGMDICCGGIIGMGETMEDRLEMAL